MKATETLLAGRTSGQRRMALVSSIIVLISAVSWASFSLASASIKRVDVFEGRVERPDRLAGSAINYLIVGSDTRVGLTKAEIKELRVGSTAVAAGKRADTMILVHINKAETAQQLFQYLEIHLQLFQSGLIAPEKSILQVIPRLMRLLEKAMQNY